MKLHVYLQLEINMKKLITISNHLLLFIQGDVNINGKV